MNLKKFISTNKGEILGVTSIVCGAAAVVSAFIESPTTHTHYQEHKINYEAAKNRRFESKGTEMEGILKRDERKILCETAKDAVLDTKFTIIFGTAALVTGIAGLSILHNDKRYLAAAAASSAGWLAVTEAAIEDIYGADGLRKIKERRLESIEKTEKVVNPETGEIEERKYTVTPPNSLVLDEHAKEVIDTLPVEVQAAFDLAHTVCIDNDVFGWKSCNNNIDFYTPILKNEMDNMNHRMQNQGEITLREQIEALGFKSSRARRFNQHLLKSCGTIDTPRAYDNISKQWINVKGFNSDGIAYERYGEYTHKTLSYGEDQDRYIFSKGDYRDNPYFIVDGKILLNLSYDGNIANIDPEEVTDERKRSAWIEDPKHEQ